MIESLLNKEDQSLFELYLLLKKKRKLPLSVILTKLDLSYKTLWSLIRHWNSAGDQLECGIDFLVGKRAVQLTTGKIFHEQRFFAFLLQRGQPAKLLNRLLTEPTEGLKSLTEKLYISEGTIRRRLMMLQPLLHRYRLTANFQKLPVLSGSEAQIRLLTFHMRLLQQPLLHRTSPAAYFAIFQQILRDRQIKGHRLTRDWYDQECLWEELGWQEFILDEPGSLFLWRQLFGLEEIWLSHKYQQIFNEKIFPLDRLFHSPQQRQQIVADIYRAHLYCTLFSGPCFLFFAQGELSEASRLLTEKLSLLCPAHQKMLVRHPELPWLYDAIMERFPLPQAQEILLSEY